METFNRLNDLYFKKLLGDKKRKNLTLSFLNGVLNKDDENYFTDISFLDKDNEPLTLDGKLSKLDIRADLNDGTQVDIEVQVCPFKFMAERSLYYWSKMYSEQLAKGAEYKKLKKAIAINLLAFVYLKDEQDWHNIYNLLNVKSHNKLTAHIEIHFLELPKFTLRDMRKIRTSEAWIAYFSGKYSKEELEEIAMTTPAIKEAVEFEDTFLQDKIERRAYEQREKAIRDYYSYISAFKEEGLEQGMKEGLEQGLKQGLEQGLKQGLEQGLEQGLKKGLQENKIQNVVNGLKEGIDINIIAKITKVSIQDIEKIKIEFNL